MRLKRDESSATSAGVFMLLVERLCYANIHKILNWIARHLQAIIGLWWEFYPVNYAKQRRMNVVNSSLSRTFFLISPGYFYSPIRSAAKSSSSQVNIFNVTRFWRKHLRCKLSCFHETFSSNWERNLICTRKD